MKLAFYVSSVMLLATIWSTAWAVSPDWSDMKGCYSTVTFNGQSASSTDLFDRGHANFSGSFVFATMPGTDHVRTFEFNLFQYKSGNMSYFDMVVIFPDFGKIEVSADGRTRTYSFSGPMTCTGLCPTPTGFTYETKVEVTDLGNDLYQVHNYRHIPELPDRSMDADDVYVIKREREFCSLTQCTQNPDGSMTCTSTP
jgi:hypothetical protein